MPKNKGALLKEKINQDIEALAYEYIEGAKTLLASSHAKNESAEFSNVIIYLIRHSIELRIKRAYFILKLFKSLKIEGVKTHDIKDIFINCRRDLENTFLYNLIKNNKSEDTLNKLEELISFVSKLDPWGVTKRYPCDFSEKDEYDKQFYKLFIDDGLVKESMKNDIVNPKINATGLIEKLEKYFDKFEALIQYFECSVKFDRIFGLTRQSIKLTYVSYYEIYALLAIYSKKYDNIEDLEKILLSLYKDARLTTWILNFIINHNLLRPFIDEKVNLLYLDINDVNNLLSDLKSYLYWESIQCVKNIEELDDPCCYMEAEKLFSQPWDKKIKNILKKYDKNKISECMVLFNIGRDRIYIPTNYEADIKNNIKKDEDSFFYDASKLFRKNSPGEFLLGLSTLGIISMIDKSHIKICCPICI